jgi:sulfur carrier protein
MKIILNGKEHKFEGEITILELIQNLKQDQKGIVVQINENIIPKNSYDNHRLKNGDQVELIRFMAGG